MRGTSRIPGRQNACRCHGVALTGVAVLAGAIDELSESVEAKEAAPRLQALPREVGSEFGSELVASSVASVSC